MSEYEKFREDDRLPDAGLASRIEIKQTFKILLQGQRIGRGRGFHW
jgi:hypothetical protein